MCSHGGTTARAVTFFRALTEVDPLAERLLDRSLRRRLAFWCWMARRGLSLDRLSLRFISAIGVRSRFFDVCLERAAEGGLAQVVLVGAGFDTRSLRCPSWRR